MGHRDRYFSGTDVPGNQGSALSEIKDLVSVAKAIVIDKDFVPPLGTDLTTWTNYYLKSTSNRDIYHNVYLYRGSLFDQHYLAAKALYKEYEHLTDEEEERYGIFNQGYYYIGESDTCGDIVFYKIIKSHLICRTTKHKVIIYFFIFTLFIS